MATFQGTNKTITLSEFLATHKPHLMWGHGTEQLVRDKLRITKPEKIAMGGDLPLTQRNLRWLKNDGWVLLPTHVYIQSRKHWKEQQDNFVAIDTATACCILESDGQDEKLTIIDANCNLLRVERSSLHNIVTYMHGQGFTLNEDVSLVNYRQTWYTILGYKSSSELLEYPTELFLAEGDALFSDDDGQRRAFCKQVGSTVTSIKFLTDMDITSKIAQRKVAVLKSREYAKNQRERDKASKAHEVNEIHELMQDVGFRNNMDAIFIGGDFYGLTYNAFLNHFQFPGNKKEAWETLTKNVKHLETGLINPVLSFFAVDHLINAGWNLKTDEGIYIDVTNPSVGVCRLLDPNRVYKQEGFEGKLVVLRGEVPGQRMAVVNYDSIAPVQDYVRGLGFYPITIYKMPLKKSRTQVTLIGQAQNPAIAKHSSPIIYLTTHQHAKFVKYGIGDLTRVEIANPPVTFDWNKK